jgi:hypothetical protein
MIADRLGVTEPLMGILRALVFPKRYMRAGSPYLTGNKRAEIAQLLIAQRLNKLPKLLCTDCDCPVFKEYILDPRRGIGVGYFVRTHSSRSLNTAV